MWSLMYDSNVQIEQIKYTDLVVQVQSGLLKDTARA